MHKALCLLFTFLSLNSFAQAAGVDSAFNVLKLKKVIYKPIDVFELKQVPAHIKTTGIRFFRDTLFLFNFMDRDNAEQRTGIFKDSSLLKKNPSYLHYALGQHGNKRAFYVRGKFKTLDIHHAYLEGQQLGLDTCFVYPDTSVMIVTRLHRYIFTQWKPYNTNDTAYHAMNVVFVFNKNNKLLHHFAYNNPATDFLSTIGFFNKDDQLDMLFYDKTEIKEGQSYSHFSLYSFNKKGKTKKKKFYKGDYSIAIKM